MSQQKISHCHKRIRDVAQGLAAASYEELMSQNLLYDAWKRQHPGMGPLALEKLFVRKKWGLYIDLARATLVGLLQQPNNPNLDEKAKEEIMEILALDSTLIRGRVNPKVLAGTVVNPR